MKKAIISVKAKNELMRFFLWIIYVISVLLLLCFRARLFINALWSPAGIRPNLLALVYDVYL